MSAVLDMTNRHTTATERRNPFTSPDVIAGIVLAVVFAGAIVAASGWDRHAAIFPLSVSGLGLLLAVAQITVGVRKALHPAAPPAETPSAVPTTSVTQEELPEDALDSIFNTATARQWIVTLGWFALFFIALYVAGLYVAAPVFTVLYLKSQDDRSWLFSGVYAVVLTAVLYLAFSVLLAQPVPPGLFGLA